MKMREMVLECVRHANVHSSSFQLLHCFFYILQFDKVVRSACVYPLRCGLTQARSPFESLELWSSLSVGHKLAVQL